MNYLLLNTDLSSTRLTPALDQFVTVDLFQGTLPEVDDNYYMREEFGLYEGDSELALGHAICMIHRIQSARDTDAHARCEHYTDMMFEDLDRFLRLCFGMHENADNYLRSIFALSVNFGFIDRIAPFAEAYYREEYLDAAKEDRHPPALDYEQLYEMLGDYALFVNCDAQGAMRFYQLADLDWFLLRDSTSRNEFAVDENRKIRLMHYHKRMLLLQALYDEAALPEAFLGGEREEVPFWGAYFATRELLRSTTSTNPVKIAQAAETCMLWLQSLLTSEELDADRLRPVLIAAHNIKKSCIFQTVYTLGRDTSDKKQQHGDAAIEAMAAFQHGKHGLIGAYIRNHRADHGLLELIFWLCQAVRYTEAIKSTLLVREIGQDMAYYTSVDTMLYMMPEKATDDNVYGKLSVMHIAYMNDPNEGKTLGRFLLNEHDAKKPRGTRRSIAYPFVFMKCFTSLVDDLPMWEMYGDRAKGCCIVMDWTETIKRMPSNVNVPLYRICYITDAMNVSKTDNPKITHLASLKSTLQRLANCAKAVCSTPDAKKLFDEITEDIVYLFKNSDYSHEQELRILYHKHPTDTAIRHTAGDPPLLYVQTEFNVCIKEIIMGPKSQNMPRRIPYIQQRLHTMCEKTATPLPQLSISAIEYI